MRALKRISKALGILALGAAPALAQAPGNNQTTADRVADVLRAPATQAGSKIGIEAREGLVTLSGTVKTPALKAELIGRAQRVAGVAGIIDQLRVAGDQRVIPAQFQPGPSPAMTRQPAQVAMGGHLFGHGHHGGGEVMEGPVMDGAAAGPVDMGPMPEGMAGSGATQAAMPGAPNYAWPSYAPYPNFSAVGYPTAYPWQAWPNIGPFYPYPEVPLDWRAVTLRWDDGIWWLDFRKHYTRPFFTPYPFGILAY